MSKWHVSIPWLTTFASLATLIVLGVFLILNIEWFKEGVFDENIAEYRDPHYRFYAYHMHMSLIRRSVALFSGFALMLIGMSAVFYTIKEKIVGEVKTEAISANLATASPGIIAIIAGCYMIIATVQSKDEFPEYKDSPYKRPKREYMQETEAAADSIQAHNDHVRDSTINKQDRK